jgi:hypothetical protein
LLGRPLDGGEEVAELLECRLVRVRDGGQFDVRHALPTARMAPRNRAASDDRATASISQEPSIGTLCRGRCQA